MNGWPVIDIAYPIEIPSGIRFLEANVGKAYDNALDEIAGGLAEIYRDEIQAAGAVDTRFFIDTVGIRYAKRNERGVGSLAGYAGVVEHGWIYRGQGQKSYPGRFPAAKAIVKLDAVVYDAFERQLYR